MRPFIYPEAKKVLEKLYRAGKKLAVVSSHPGNILCEEAKEYGLEKYFGFFVGDIKDKTEAILDICKKSNTIPSLQNVAYIGDSIYDTRVAKGAGVYSIAITGGYHTKEKLQTENPDKIIENLAELL